MDEWEKKETPRQRVKRLRKQITYWKCHGYSRYGEPDICYICQHFTYFRYYEGGGDVDCLVNAPHWKAGDDPILVCRLFKAEKLWRFKCERILSNIMGDVIKDLTGRLNDTLKQLPLKADP